MGIRRSFKRTISKILRKLQGKKGKLRLVVVLGGILFLILIAALITGVFYKSVSDYYVPPREIAEWDLPSVNADITEPPIASNTPATDESFEPKPSEEEEPTAEELPQTSTAETPEPDKGASATPTPESSESGDVPVQVSENDDKYIDSSIGNEEVIDDAWLDNKIKEHESELDPVDVEDFRAIIAKLDQGLIKGLASNGFTDEEAAQLIKHMKQNLTDEEYARSKELFKRYNYLLEDE